MMNGCYHGFAAALQGKQSRAQALVVMNDIESVAVGFKPGQEAQPKGYKAQQSRP